MSDAMGRDKVWNPEIWQSIDEAVLEEVSRIRVCQKVFPAAQIAGADSAPLDDATAGPPLTIAAGRSRPILPISLRFAMTQGQVDEEPQIHNGRTLAHLAAKSLARAEDMLLLDGFDEAANTTTNGMALPQGCTLENPGSVGQGILGAAGANRSVPRIGKAAGGGWGPNLFAAVTAGIATLEGNGHPGPYALMLQSTAFADAYVPVNRGLATTADRLIPLLPGGFYSTGALPTVAGKPTGLLVSLGGEPTILYLSQDAITGYTQQDADGLHQFRVFEKIQYVVRDSDAVLRLDFQ